MCIPCIPKAYLGRGVFHSRDGGQICSLCIFEAKQPNLPILNPNTAINQIAHISAFRNVVSVQNCAKKMQQKKSELCSYMVLRLKNCKPSWMVEITVSGIGKLWPSICHCATNAVIPGHRPCSLGLMESSNTWEWGAGSPMTYLSQFYRYRRIHLW